MFSKRITKTDENKQRKKRSIYYGILVSLVGSILIYHIAVLPHFNYWGLEDDEKTMAMPDDEFVTDPIVISYHAITIDAPSSEVWKWLVQVGGNKAGWYSMTWAENMGGMGVYNTYELRPEWQKLEKGDKLLCNVRGNVGIVEDIVPGKYIAQRWDSRVDDSNYESVFYERTGETIKLINWYFFPKNWEGYDTWLTWVYYIKELPDGKSRLYSRCYMDWTDHNRIANFILRTAIEVPHALMDVEMLKQIRDCAEGNASKYKNTKLPEGGSR